MPPDGVADSTGRSAAIIQHLNAVLRFYRDAGAPIQTVGEPSDTIYRDQTLTLASQIAESAFASAKAEAGLMNKSFAAAGSSSTDQNQAQKVQGFRDSVTQRIAALKTQDADLEKQLGTARAKEIPALKQQRQQVEGELELQTAIEDALGKLTSISEVTNETGFGAQINQLERSAPGLAAGKPTVVAPTLENLASARNAGVTSQGRVLFELLSTRQSIENLITEANALHKQTVDLRTPLVDSLRKTIAQGEALAQQNNAAAPAPNTSAGTSPPKASQPTASQAAAALTATRQNFDQLTAKFKQLASASVPLSQEVIAIEQSQASLRAWGQAVDREYSSILRSLLLRVLAIAVSLGVIFLLGAAWRRATTRYVHDLRRRRQLLVVRRLVIGFLSGLVMIFGLVTQFSSLATFAGFITAGIAVGLQTILLSVAAYFFIIGRYGVKVGDRITIAGVTGDVAEVGLVRFYVLELAGSGTDLYPSGRVAVFSNAVLFQAAMPLYKQMPETDYIWHEMTIKLTPDVDYRPAVQAIVKSVQSIYGEYRDQIQAQHRAMESWMDSSVEAPDVQSSLQLVDGGGLQLWLRFPVPIRRTAEIDDRMTETLLQTIAADPKVKAAVSAPPVIKAAVRG
jgi:small-conductance mechanosensitive channel